MDTPINNAADTTFEGIARAVSKAETIGILTHRRPDGDAIGSCLALGDALAGIGKTVILIDEDPVPESLEFLAGAEKFGRANSVAAPHAVDLLMVLDAAGADRVGEGAWAAFANRGPVVNIDHHISNTRFGDLNYVDDVSPATGQIIYQLIRDRDWPLTDAARDALYVAISTDTGCFRYPNTTAATYRIGADLIDQGLDIGAVSQQLYESYPLRRLLLLRELLQGMIICEDGRVAAVKLTRAMAEAVGMSPSDTEGLIDVIRSIDTVIVAVFFEEMPNGKIRVSSRSKTPRVNVGEICGVFGGGGHKLAAGARMKGPIDDAAERFINEVTKRLNGLD